MRRPYIQLYCHLVWCTWDRLPMISREAEPRLYEEMRSKVRELGCVPIAVGGTEDHVHLLCSYHANIAISYLVQQVKGSSSHLLTHAVSGMKQFKWQGAYGAFSVGRDGVEAVQDYVLNQRFRHADGRLWTEWEQVWQPEEPNGADE